MDVLINTLVVVSLLAVGYFIGGSREQQHILGLEKRELRYQHVQVSSLRTLPGLTVGPQPPRLVVSEVVIATDYLKTFIASLQQLVGGELRTYRSLTIRARREAVLRLVEQAHSAGFNAVGNLRMEAADIGGNAGTRRGVPMVGLVASGTAYYCRRMG